MGILLWRMHSPPCGESPAAHAVMDAAQRLTELALNQQPAWHWLFMTVHSPLVLILANPKHHMDWTRGVGSSQLARKDCAGYFIMLRSATGPAEAAHSISIILILGAAPYHFWYSKPWCPHPWCHKPSCFQPSWR